MIFSCARPYAFYGLLVLVPAVLIEIAKSRVIVAQSRRIASGGSASFGGTRVKNLPRILFLRTLFRALAWVMLVFAYAGFSWGTYEAPVAKSGGAVSFVFDISYSMNAADAPGGQTRLRAATRYAELLLERMEGTPISVALAKGSGLVVVPLTEDKSVVRSLLASLSPNFMSSAGSSLGKGIAAALESFPPNSARSARIWLFSDGEESDGELSAALNDCMKYGVNVSLIGFGGEREVETLAGDGETKVMTALRSERLETLALRATNYAAGIGSSATVSYINAAAPGSALSLLRPLESNGGEAALAYEVRAIERHNFFLMLALVFFALSFVAAEFNLENFRKRFQKNLAATALNRAAIFTLACASAIVLSSCKNHRASYAVYATETLSGAWEWSQKNYAKAAAEFLRVEEDAANSGDTLAEQYARYNLAATYLAQNEDEAAAANLEKITPDAPDSVRYAAHYNLGVIAYRAGDWEKAADCFRAALLIDGTKIEAKENLEIALRQKSAQAARPVESELLPAVQNDERANAIESAIFERIRENDERQWKNSMESERQGSPADY